jgi:hypothetical protein
LVGHRMSWGIETSWRIRWDFMGADRILMKSPSCWDQDVTKLSGAQQMPGSLLLAIPTTILSRISPGKKDLWPMERNILDHFGTFFSDFPRFPLTSKAPL